VPRERQSDRLCLRLTPTESALLRREAERRGVSMAVVLREFIRGLKGRSK
jgi:predicted HicB family RNase H-like nuclease